MIINNNYPNKKIAVAMSGGVDSSVSALLLKNQGYDVIGITGIMHDCDDVDAFIEKARHVCDVIGIEHYAADLKSEFKDKVVSYFEETYKQGKTPNPCAVCNKNIKWGALRKYAVEKLGAKYFATGHYANILNDNGLYKLVKAEDSRKEQLYMLFELKQEDLKYTIFPLFNYKKSEVREIAKKYNLPCAEAPESQDVCFIKPPMTTQKYLEDALETKPGDIIDIRTGEIAGKHDGIHNFTIGQRKGIGISSDIPLYVISIDPESNKVIIGPKESAYQKEFSLEDINWQHNISNSKDYRVLVKVRYNSSAVTATITAKENSNILVRADEPVFSITPGQAAVFYHIDEGFLIGGGWII